MKTVFIILFTSLLGFQALSQDAPVLYGIYEFDIGDVFHYKDNEGWVAEEDRKVINITILDKWYQGRDNVCYKRQNQTSRTLTNNYTDSIYYYSSNNIDTVCYPNLLEWEISNAMFTSSFTDASLYNGRMIYDFFMSDLYCEYWSNYYVPGLGKTYLYMDCTGGGNPWWLFRLVYYKKGSEEWGNMSLVQVSEIDEEHKIRLYPNPVSSVLHIEKLPVSVQQINIIDALGRVVLSSKESEINVEHLEPGIYFLKTQIDDRSITQSFIKK